MITNTEKKPRTRPVNIMKPLKLNRADLRIRFKHLHTKGFGKQDKDFWKFVKARRS